MVYDCFVLSDNYRIEEIEKESLSVKKFDGKAQEKAYYDEQSNEKDTRRLVLINCLLSHLEFSSRHSDCLGVRGEARR